jgi:hypothetical protein
MWSVNPKEEHRLRVLEKMVAGKIFGPKRKEIKRGMKKVLKTWTIHQLRQLF